MRNSAKQSPETVEVFDLIHAGILEFFPDLVAQLGGNPASLLKHVGLTRDDIADGHSRATYRQMAELLELAAAVLRCADFGLRLALLQSGARVFGPLGTVMRNSKTFGDALAYVSKHSYAHSLAARVWLRRSSADKTVFSGHDILLDRMPNKTQAIEQILFLGHLGAMEITGGRARVRRVHFRHQPVSPLKTYRRYFGCEVRFGQNEDGVVFSDQDMACPVVEPDVGAYQSAISFIDAKFTRHAPPLGAQARGFVMQYLGTEHCTNERIAADLNLHPRTLHRRLAAEGTSFQKIKDQVRRDVMLYYLQQTNLDFSRISEVLGFAEQSVMTRRCKHWLSSPPSKIRRMTQRMSPVPVNTR